MVAQMLDMFSDGVEPEDAQDSLLALYPRYDLSAVRPAVNWKADHPEIPSFAWTKNERIKLLTGGYLATLFGVSPILTKTPLFEPSRGAVPTRIHHFLSRGNLADVSAVLYHFKLTSSFVRRLTRDVRENVHPNTAHYRQLAAAVARNVPMSVVPATASRYGGVSRLVEEGIIVCSPEWERWVADRDQRSRSR